MKLAVWIGMILDAVCSFWLFGYGFIMLWKCGGGAGVQGYFGLRHKPRIALSGVLPNL